MSNGVETDFDRFMNFVKETSEEFEIFNRVKPSGMKETLVAFSGKLFKFDSKMSFNGIYNFTGKNELLANGAFATA